MKPGEFLTIADQAAEYLRAEIRRGRWIGFMPGKHQLAAELGLNNKTVEAALKRLEAAGVLLPRGAGRKRLIQAGGAGASRALRIALLLNAGVHELQSRLNIQLVHALTDSGHWVAPAVKSLAALRFEPKRVARMVEQTEADAWIVSSGSRAVLEWFAGQSTPAFALFGHRVGLKIASVGPDKTKILSESVRHLSELGHRRIVLLCRKIRRLPHPGAPESAFLETMRALRCPAGDYNLPDWDETDAGFQACLGALFRHTPPTALIVDEAPYFVATMQFLLSRGIRVPAEVSLICTDDDPAFSHCSPPISCITWDTGPVLRRIVSWVANVSRGRADHRQTLTPARLVLGGTLARAR